MGCVPAEALGRAELLLQQRLARERQSHYGERPAWRCPGPENWLFTGSDVGEIRSGHLFCIPLSGPAGSEFRGGRGEAALRHGPYSGLACEPVARSAAIETDLTSAALAL